MTEFIFTADWDYVADGVMGGLSRGGMTREVYKGRMAAVLRGDVSLENNGGFVQIAFNLPADHTGFDASAWQGIKLEVCGNGALYDIRLRSLELTRPWQSYRAEFHAASTWQSIHIPFAELAPHRTESPLDLTKLRRMGILGIGREFHAEIAIASAGLYRG